MGISRLSLWNDLGSISVVEPMLLTAYEHEAERAWREGNGRHTTSFYVSAFPGDDEYACGRAAVYSLMDVPNAKPFDAKTQAIFDVGKNHELEWVRRLAADGRLLSGDESIGEKQTKFTDPAIWLSGAVDAIVLPPFWRKSHCIEIKTTSHEKVMQMRDNRARTVYSHGKYTRQLKTYIGYANEQPFAPEVAVCTESWAITTELAMGMRWCPVHQTFDCEIEQFELEPPDDGTLIYSSRDEPFTTVSFYYEYDPEFLAAGRAKLADWRKHYRAGTIPAHPRQGERSLWSVEPCKYCDFKPACKLDFKEKVNTLADSHMSERAREVRPDYEYAEARARVFARWGETDPLLKAAQ